MRLKILSLIVLLIGIVMGIILVKQSQDIRSKAANSSDYDSCYSQCLADRGLHLNEGNEQCNKQCGEPAGECNFDSDCKPPRRCQNNQCIGNSSVGGVGEKLKQLKQCQRNSGSQSILSCFMSSLYR